MMPCNAPLCSYEYHTYMYDSIYIYTSVYILYICACVHTYMHTCTGYRLKRIDRHAG